MKKIFMLTIALFVTVLSSCADSSKQSSNQATDTVPSSKGQADKALTLEDLKPPVVADLFSYENPSPDEGKLKGVVELGATGFNSFVIRIDKDKNWELVKARYGRSSIIEEGATTEETKAKLKDYISMLIKDGVQGKYIYFVVSSGAAKEPIVQKISTVLKAQGYYVNIVTPEQEAKFAFLATVPKEFQDKGFVLDIGSGNSKLAFLDGSKLKTIETYGSKYSKKSLDNKLVYKEIQSISSEIPKDKTKYCFIIGGVPYKLAKFTNGGKTGDKRYITLSSNAGDYSLYAELKGEKILCGLNIYSAVLKTTSPQYVIFDAKTNFTIGYILQMKY